MQTAEQHAGRSYAAPPRNRREPPPWDPQGDGGALTAGGLWTSVTDHNHRRRGNSPQRDSGRAPPERGRFSPARERSYSRDNAREREWHRNDSRPDSRSFRAPGYHRRSPSPHRGRRRERSRDQYDTGRYQKAHASQLRTEARSRLSAVGGTATGREDIVTAKGIMFSCHIFSETDVHAWLADPQQQGSLDHKDRIGSLIMDMGWRRLSLHTSRFNSFRV